MLLMEKTYVWLTEDNKRIIGYYSLGTGYLERVLKDEKSRVKLGGSIHINGFALDRKYHVRTKALQKMERR